MNWIRSNYWITSSILIMLLSAGWIWISSATPGETTSGNTPAPRKGFLAPEFNLESSSGEVISLSELRGQPVLLNIWASWCSPCRAEMPSIEQTYQDFQSQGFVVLGINASNQDDSARALAFAGEQDLTFPILFDTQGEVSRLYQVRALPSSFFIDSQGIIQDVVVGGPMSEALLKIRVQQLFEGKTKEQR